MDFVTPELLEELIAERRRAASSILLRAGYPAAQSRLRLRRLAAGALAFVAARIHFESAQTAIALRNAAETDV